jgi:adenylate cyclase
MNFLDRIERLVALPGDSETWRSQKTLAALLYLATGPITFFAALSYYMGGLTTAGLVYMGFGLLLVLAFFIEVRYPIYHVQLAYVVFVAALASNLLVHLLSGGITSGSIDIAWTVLTPVLAILLLNRRALFIAMIPFLATVVAVVVFEPWARANMPVADPNFRLMGYAFCLASLGITIALASLYLLGQIESYRQRADDLLLNILPGSIATQLKERPGTIADGYNEVSVLFADIVDFTSTSSDADPVDVVNLLNNIFSEFDDLAAKHDLEKIKTIGDAYMVAAGLPERRADHATAIMAFATDLLETVDRFEGFDGEAIRIRIGINTGPVVAGVIGRQKFIYDLWGDAVNVASRMESNGLSNRIQVTRAVKEKLDGRYSFVRREPIFVKGKGMMVTYLLEI